MPDLVKKIFVKAPNAIEVNNTEQDSVKKKVMVKISRAELEKAAKIRRDEIIRKKDSIINRSFNATNFNKENPLTKEEYNKVASQAAKVKTIEVDCKNIGSSYKRGKTTGSCVSGETYKGQSLKDTD
jgi:hypothetical protein